ncbi:unnamed protein product [Colias eurytheme]|nr:unnamed protein product [Colias eurytheme]
MAKSLDPTENNEGGRIGKVIGWISADCAAAFRKYIEYAEDAAAWQPELYNLERVRQITKILNDIYWTMVFRFAHRVFLQSMTLQPSC